MRRILPWVWAVAYCITWELMETAPFVDLGQINERSRLVYRFSQPWSLPFGLCFTRLLCNSGCISSHDRTFRKL